jgi:hypothetical protein
MVNFGCKQLFGSFCEVFFASTLKGFFRLANVFASFRFFSFAFHLDVLHFFINYLISVGKLPTLKKKKRISIEVVFYLECLSCTMLLFIFPSLIWEMRTASVDSFQCTGFHNNNDDLWTYNISILEK